MTVRFLTRTLAISLAGLSLAFAQTGRNTSQPDSAPPISGLAELKEFDKTLRAFTPRVMKATVSLRAARGGGSGSGVLVSEDGLILTAAHVTDVMKDGVIVIFPDGKRVEGKVLGADYDRDASMVKITKEGKYPFVALGKSRGLRRNDWAIALGHAGGFDALRTPPVRLGRVLGSGQFLETDAAVVGGDSGGPLFNEKGELIGIHSNIGASLSQNRHVPIEVYRDQWDDLLAGKKQGSRFANQTGKRAVLGVQLANSDDGGQGVLIAGVSDGSPAQGAGLEAGDRIVNINGKEIKNRGDLVSETAKFKAGRKIKLSYLRGDEVKEVEVKLVKAEDLNSGLDPENEEPENDEDDRKDSEAKVEPLTGKAREDLVTKLLERTIRQNGRLELTREEAQLLGGRRKVIEEFQKRMQTMKPEDLRKLMPQGVPDINFQAMMDALRPVTSKSKASTVSLLVEGKKVCLGTVIHRDGWILTKNTEIGAGEVLVEVDGKPRPAEVAERFPVRDLALVKVDAAGLQPVRWMKGQPSLGQIITAPSSDGEPLGVGLVSVKPRALGKAGFLGVFLEDGDNGVTIARLVEKGAAEAAGLKTGDRILQIDGKVVKASNDLSGLIQNRLAGTVVEIKVARGGKTLDFKATLLSRPANPTSGRLERMNQMSGRLSERRGGFPEVLQHDIPMDPSECGGPLIDLNGNCLGINVSRSGRIRTYAIPSADLRTILKSLPKPPAPAKTVTVDRAELDALRQLVGDIESDLAKLKAKLRKLEAAESR